MNEIEISICGDYVGVRIKRDDEILANCSCEIQYLNNWIMWDVESDSKFADAKEIAEILQDSIPKLQYVFNWV